MNAFLVTGGSRGLGHEFAIDKLKKGFEVVLLFRSEAALRWSQEFGSDYSNCSIVTGNFSQPDYPDHLSNFLEERKLRITKVLHAAGGGLGHKDPLLSTSQFQELIEANLFGAIAVNRSVIPLMEQEGFGRIVHVGSTASTHAIGSVGYNTVKTALAAYVRSLGREFVKQDISICGINPGAFEGRGNSMVRLKEAKPGAYKAFVEDRLPRGRMMSAQELFPLIDLLHSNSGLALSGSMVSIDAGESVAYDLD